MGVQGITETDIANFLAASPGFFERHAELLGSIQLTSPHGQRAVSLQERQMEMLRDKIKGLERQIVEMIRNGQDNVAIADKLHRWTRALMLTANAADLPAVLVSELQHQFQIPQAAIRVWGGALARADPAPPREPARRLRPARAGVARPDALYRRHGDRVPRSHRRSGKRGIDEAAAGGVMRIGRDPPLRSR